MPAKTSSLRPRQEEIDLEQWSQQHPDHPPPPCRRYRIRIDRERYVVEVPEMTGRELLTLAGKTPPERFALYQKLRGGQTRRIALDETVSFRQPGIERFVTNPLDATEGEADLRRQFRLPPEDEGFLASLGLPWETVVEGKVRRLVLLDFQPPSGYTHPQVAVNLRIEPSYPDTQIDMAYFHPALARVGGRPIKALASDPFDGKVWQRWSRHRTGQNPWRPGVDNLETHLLLVQDWLERELR